MRYCGAIAIAILLTGCTVPGFKVDSGRFAVEPDARADAPPLRMIPITAAELGNVVTSNTDDRALLPPYDPAPYEYRIGSQDVLSVTVWDHPELTIPAGSFRSADAAGHVVDVNGKIFYPYVGDVTVAGLTIREVREKLTRRLAQYITNPQLDLRVAAFRSQRVHVTGEIVDPGVIPVTDTPPTILDMLVKGGGETTEADLSRVTLSRDGQAYRINLQALLEEGDVSQNVLLRHGDVVNVPDRSTNKVFVLGEVIEPGHLLMNRGRMSLAEALSLSGGLDQDRSDPSRIFVIRGNVEQPDIYWLQARSPETMLLADGFRLQPSDVVYVSSTKTALWNRMVREILPTVQAIFQTTVAVDRIKN